jgi:hypothetical protein
MLDGPEDLSAMKRTASVSRYSDKPNLSYLRVSNRPLRPFDFENFEHERKSASGNLG